MRASECKDIKSIHEEIPSNAPNIVCLFNATLELTHFFTLKLEFVSDFIIGPLYVFTFLVWLWPLNFSEQVLKKNVDGLIVYQTRVK